MCSEEEDCLRQVTHGEETLESAHGAKTLLDPAADGGSATLLAPSNLTDPGWAACWRFQRWSQVRRDHWLVQRSIAMRRRRQRLAFSPGAGGGAACKRRKKAVSCAAPSLGRKAMSSCRYTKSANTRSGSLSTPDGAGGRGCWIASGRQLSREPGHVAVDMRMADAMRHPKASSPGERTGNPSSRRNLPVCTMTIRIVDCACWLAPSIHPLQLVTLDLTALLQANLRLFTSISDAVRTWHLLL